MAKKEKEKNNKHFWKDFKAELKKVIWPTKKQLTNNTMVVIAMVLVTTVIVLVLDLAFEALNTYGINKVKSAVQNSITQTTDENKDSTENDNQSSEENNDENNSSEENSSEADNSENNNSNSENNEENTDNNNNE